MSVYDLIDSVNVAVAVASANGVIPNADANGRAKVLLTSSTNCYWNSGVTTVTATSADRYLPANTPIAFRLPHGHDNIGVIRDTADGDLTIHRIG